MPCGNPELFDELLSNLDAAAYETPLLRMGKRARWPLFEKDITCDFLTSLHLHPSAP